MLTTFRSWPHSPLSSFLQRGPAGDRVDGTSTPGGCLEDWRGQAGVGGEGQRGGVGQCGQCACYSSNQVKNISTIQITDYLTMERNIHPTRSKNLPHTASVPHYYKKKSSSTDFLQGCIGGWELLWSASPLHLITDLIK